MEQYKVAFLGKAVKAPFVKKLIGQAFRPGIRERVLMGPPSVTKKAGAKLATKLGAPQLNIGGFKGYMPSVAFPGMLQDLSSASRYPALIAHEAAHVRTMKKLPGITIGTGLAKAAGEFGAWGLGIKRGFRRPDEKRPSKKKIVGTAVVGHIPNWLLELQANIASSKYPGARKIIPVSLGGYTTQPFIKGAWAGLHGWLLGRAARVFRKKPKKELHMLQPIHVINYGIGRGMGKLTGRGVRGMWKGVRRHPKAVRTAGVFGTGVITAKELERRRKKRLGIKPVYALDVSHYTLPSDYWDLPAQTGLPGLKTKLKKSTSAGVKAGKMLGKGIVSGTSRGVKLAILALAVKEIADLLSKQPYMPTIRSDIEMTDFGYQIETMNQVVQYAGVLPSPILQTIKSKGGVALQKTKKGVERGLLLWLMGFISAELLARGITSPKKRHEVTLPQQGYARQNIETLKKRALEVQPKRKRRFTDIETLKKRALKAQPYADAGYKKWGALTPAVETGKKLAAGWKHPKITKIAGRKVAVATRIGSLARRHPGLIAGTALGTLGLRELRKIRKQREKKYAAVLSMGPGMDKFHTAKILGDTPKGFQPYNPRVSATTGMGPMPKWKGKWHAGKGTKVALGLLLPAAALAARQVALRKQKKTWKERIKKKLGYMHDDYSFGTAARVLGRGLKKIKPWKRVKQASDVALVGLIGSEVVGAVKRGRQRQPQVLPPVPKRSPTISSYGIETYPMKSEAQRRWMHATHPEMAEEWEKKTGKKKLPEKVSKHALGMTKWKKMLLKRRVHQAQRILSDERITSLLHDSGVSKEGIKTLLRVKGRKPPLIVTRRKHRLVAGAAFGGGVAAGRLSEREKVSQHSLATAVARLRDLRKISKSRVIGKELNQWAMENAAAILKKITPKTPLAIKKQIKEHARKWKVVAGEADDLIAKGRLEKAGIVAAGVAGAAAAHETGKRRERARVHRVVG